jgi:NADH:ubiquinone oxidoreductase subunit 6 (subunit J)
MTFLIIQAYTLYFWQIAVYLGPIVATFIAGAATLWLVFALESKRRSRQ